MIETINTNNGGALNEAEFIVPKGYRLVKVVVGQSDEVAVTCSQCGGSSLHTAARCIYCGVARTHYEYQLDDGRLAQRLSRIPGQVTVSYGSLEGCVWAEEVRINQGSRVGSVIAGDNAYFEDDTFSGSVYSPIVRATGHVHFTELATSVLIATSGRVNARQVTVYDGGELVLPRFSPISELRLGEGVAEPSRLGLIAIGSIIRGNFPSPQEWNK